MFRMLQLRADQKQLVTDISHLFHPRRLRLLCRRVDATDLEGDLSWALHPSSVSRERGLLRPLIREGLVTRLMTATLLGERGPQPKERVMQKLPGDPLSSFFMQLAIGACTGWLAHKISRSKPDPALNAFPGIPAR
jgi:hypothetical protein